MSELGQGPESLVLAGLTHRSKTRHLKLVPVGHEAATKRRYRDQPPEVAVWGFLLGQEEKSSHPGPFQLNDRIRRVGLILA